MSRSITWVKKHSTRKNQSWKDFKNSISNTTHPWNNTIEL